MSKYFNRNSRPKGTKTAFDLSHEVKLSCNMGKLVPIYLQEVLPSDKFQVSTEQLVRLAPMLAPMMHRVNIFTHFFWVPNRLVFDGWQDYITGGVDGQDLTTLPQLQINDATQQAFTKGSVADYFGIPPIPDLQVIGTPQQINALPFRAYQLICNEYFRDQTLEQPFLVNKGEVVTDQETIDLNYLRDRCWEKDYFTSALPWAQRGPEVMIPTGAGTSPMGAYPPTTIVYADGATPGVPGTPVAGNPTLGSVYDGTSAKLTDANNVAQLVHIEGIGGASSGSINDLRTAHHLQKWFERNARGGARYIEQIWQHFKTKSSDARLQRPEFLGGGVNPVVISEVLSTYGTTEVPQGNMSGHGISVGHDMNFTKTFEEHGYVIGLMSVMPRTAYSQGIPRPFLKSDRYSWFWPEFAHLGEQPVYDAELYHDYADRDDMLSVFGYQERFAEYKFAPNRIAGDYRDNMNFWTMAREFSSKPALNATFVRADPTHRVFAVTDPTEHKLYVQIYNKVTAVRPMPAHANPNL